MTIIQGCQLVARGSACLEKGYVMLTELHPAGADLLFLLTLEALQ